MKIRNFNKVEKRDAYVRDKAKGASVRVAIAEEDGAEELTMSVYEVDPGGFTPLHAHPWEHAVFVVQGNGIVFDGKEECKLGRNDVLFIPKNQKHQIKNTGEQNLILTSVVPIQQD